MSGTDHSKTFLEHRQGPTIILVGPQMGENIGASARAIWNFGLDRMRLVNPRDGWPNPAAQATASGAAAVMDNVQIFDTTADAISDLTYVFATTARNRDLTQRVVTPERAMQESLDLIARGEKVGILFGPERAGLDNDDIVLADALISIPVNPAFASLNLSQSVLLLAYEWMRQSAEAPAEEMQMAGTEFAEKIEIQKLVERLERDLDARGFFFPTDKAQSMKQTLRNMFSRLPMTQADIRTLHGIFRNLTTREQSSDRK
ncbi:MAG: RNA methyltransferase [Pseudomonadota bacterium]